MSIHDSDVLKAKMTLELHCLYNEDTSVRRIQRRAASPPHSPRDNVPVDSPLHAQPEQDPADENDNQPRSETRPPHPHQIRIRRLQALLLFYVLVRTLRQLLLRHHEAPLLTNALDLGP